MWEYLIKCQFESIVQHPRDELPQQRTRLLDAGIGIDFDEPSLHPLVNEEIIAENLKTVFTIFLIESSLDGANR